MNEISMRGGIFMPEQANKTPCSLGLLAHVDAGRCVPPE